MATSEVWLDFEVGYSFDSSEYFGEEATLK
jgi:hypothetical protein